MPGNSAPGPTVFDALSLLSEVADELVVKSARDTHLAIADRVTAITGRATFGASIVPNAVHRGIASAVYAGIGTGLRATSAGLDRVASSGRGARLEDHARGRFLSAAVNGLIGDKLLRERPQMAIPMAVRVDGRDVEADRGGLTAAFPDATGQLVVFLHGLCESEDVWGTGRVHTGATYGEHLATRGWSPLLVRSNSGLPLRENGAALAGLLQQVVDAWPVEVTRIALIGHSMGGLVIRAAGAVESALPTERPWAQLVTDVVTLGTPHLGSPIAGGVGRGSRGLGLLPETAAFGRILDLRSRGVHDLVAGLAEDVAPLPDARYHLVAGTLTASPGHPLGELLGDLLVRPRSAHGRDRAGRTLFPGSDTLHVGGVDHWGLLNHPRVLRALLEWLG